MTAPLHRRAALLGAAAALPVLGSARAAAAPCPAARIGLELAIWTEAQHAADCAMLAAAPPDQAAAEHRFDAVCGHVRDLRAEASRVQATSPEGAMLQVMIASGIISTWCGGLPEDVEAELQRLLLSIVTVAEAIGGVPREAMAGEFFMPRRLDPDRGITA